LSANKESVFFFVASYSTSGEAVPVHDVLACPLQECACPLQKCVARTSECSAMGSILSKSRRLGKGSNYRNRQQSRAQAYTSEAKMALDEVSGKKNRFYEVENIF